MRHNQRGLVDVGDDVGHGEGLAAAGDAHQRLEFFFIENALCEFFDGLGLVSSWNKIGDQFERNVFHAVGFGAFGAFDHLL